MAVSDELCVVDVLQKCGSSMPVGPSGMSASSVSVLFVAMILMLAHVFHTRARGKARQSNSRSIQCLSLSYLRGLLAIVAVAQQVQPWLQILWDLHEIHDAEQQRAT